MVVRRDAELESIGKVADLPPDHSPLQIGTRGSIASLQFTILGRIRVAWEEGSWNEWHVQFSDHSSGWLAEAQGLYYLLQPRPIPSALKDSKAPALQKKITGSQQAYTVTDIKNATLISAEGELPSLIKPMEFWQSVDASSDHRAIANLEIRGQEKAWYEGFIYHPEEITWENLRPVPGWKGEPVPIEKNRTDALTCPSCAGTITHRALGLTSTLACSHCGTILDLEKGSHVTVAQKVQRFRQTPTYSLTLGSRGILEGVEWEVIGALRRKDAWSEWQEFLLYNPWQGFIWLTCFQGHWNRIRRCLDPTTSKQLHRTLHGHTYQLFSKEQATVTSVAGEFYWKVRVGERATVTDYICPPRILSSEFYPELKEITWSEGHYLTVSTINQAFQLKSPEPIGIFLNQPNPWIHRKSGLGKLSIILLVLIWVLHLGLTSTPNTLAGFPLDQNYKVADTLSPVPQENIPHLVSPPFEVSPGPRPLQITLDAPVSNAWFGIDATLVNESTGATRNASLEVDYYHGYDQGHWSEGSTTRTITLPSVPQGRYHLQWTPAADPKLTEIPYRITVTSGGGFLSNPILASLAILAWPLLTFLLSSRFETKRWSQSNVHA